MTNNVVNLAERRKKLTKSQKRPDPLVGELILDDTQILFDPAAFGDNLSEEDFDLIMAEVVERVLEEHPGYYTFTPDPANDT